MSDWLTAWMGGNFEEQPPGWERSSQSLAGTLQNNTEYFRNFPLDLYQQYFPDYKPTIEEINATNANGGRGAVRIEPKIGIELEWDIDLKRRDLNEQEIKKRDSKIAEIDAELQKPGITPEKREHLTNLREDVRHFNAKDMFMWDVHESPEFKGAIEERFGTSKEHGWRDSGAVVEIQINKGSPAETIAEANRVAHAFESRVTASDGVKLDSYSMLEGRGSPHIHWSFEHNGQNIAVTTDPETGKPTPSKFYLAAVSGVADNAQKFRTETHLPLGNSTITAGTSREHDTIRFEGTAEKNFHAEYRQNRTHTLLQNSALLIGGSRVGIENGPDGNNNPVMQAAFNENGRINVPAQQQEKYDSANKHQYVSNLTTDANARKIYGDGHISARAEEHGATYIPPPEPARPAGMNITAEMQEQMRSRQTQDGHLDLDITAKAAQRFQYGMAGMNAAHLINDQNMDSTERTWRTIQLGGDAFSIASQKIATHAGLAGKASKAFGTAVPVIGAATDVAVQATMSAKAYADSIAEGDGYAAFNAINYGTIMAGAAVGSTLVGGGIAGGLAYGIGSEIAAQEAAQKLVESMPGIAASYQISCDHVNAEKAEKLLQEATEILPDDILAEAQNFSDVHARNNSIGAIESFNSTANSVYNRNKKETNYDLREGRDKLLEADARMKAELAKVNPEFEASASRMQQSEKKLADIHALREKLETRPVVPWGTEKKDYTPEQQEAQDKRDAMLTKLDSAEKRLNNFTKAYITAQEIGEAKTQQIKGIDTDGNETTLTKGDATRNFEGMMVTRNSRTIGAPILKPGSDLEKNTEANIARQEKQQAEAAQRYAEVLKAQQQNLIPGIPEVSNNSNSITVLQESQTNKTLHELLTPATANNTSTPSEKPNESNKEPSKTEDTTAPATIKENGQPDKKAEELSPLEKARQQALTSGAIDQLNKGLTAPPLPATASADQKKSRNENRGIA